MQQSGASGERLWNGWARVWQALYQYLADDLDPWERGILDGHAISFGSSREVQDQLEAAKSRRRALLTKLSSRRRHYLDGLIHRLGAELERRARVNEI